MANDKLVCTQRNRQKKKHTQGKNSLSVQGQKELKKFKAKRKIL